jgi:hypothetical protein
MVRIKFASHPRVPAISPSPSPMASKDVGIASAEHKESSTEWLNAALVDKEPIPVPKGDEAVVFEELFCCWPSHTSTPGAFGCSSKILDAVTSTYSKCYCSNQQIYLVCHVLRRSP